MSAISASNTEPLSTKLYGECYYMGSTYIAPEWSRYTDYYSEYDYQASPLGACDRKYNPAVSALPTKELDALTGHLHS